MALSPIPASTQSDGRWKIIELPSTATNPLSIATLTGGTAADLTYGFTPDGFNYAISQDVVNDPRLTLAQNLQRPGKKTETLEVKYVRSADTKSPQQVLVEGTTGTLTIRRAVDNTTALTVGDKVDVITFVAGAQRPDAPTENGVDTLSQTLYITSVTQRDVALVA